MSLQETRTQPTILVVDSGVGGLSIYQPLWQRWPTLRYLYAFDNAGFPYGDLSADEVISRLITLIDAVQQRHCFQLVVVACNTASTAALPFLRQRFSVPIIGVVPAIKPAAAITRNGVIGLLATPATIQRPYIDELIQQFATHCWVERLGSTELVQLAEAKLRGAGIASEAIAAILLPWLQQKEVPDTVVLGCTHFSLLREELLALLPPETQVIDSIAAITRQVERILFTMGGPPADMAIQPGPAFPKASNRAYCTRWDRAAEALQPALQRYQFQSLQLISL
jgi:glutamate racemase